jgi:uncharacterized protein YecT (DUF1311 family)
MKRKVAYYQNRWFALGLISAAVPLYAADLSGLIWDPAAKEAAVMPFLLSRPVVRSDNRGYHNYGPASDYHTNTIKACAEMLEKLGPFDAAEFLEKYDIRNHNYYEEPYFIWSLAEEACRGGRFGKPNRLLAFQLVIRGDPGCASEFTSAVEEALRKWQNNEPYQFAIEDHVHTTWCHKFFSAREHCKVNQLCKSKMTELDASLLTSEPGKAIVAYDQYAVFVEEKAYNEEGHDGSGRGIWATDSIIKHKKEYVKLANSVAKGFRPASEQSYEVADRKLNKVYKALIADLKKSPLRTGAGIAFTHEEIIAVQRLWIPYRDSTAGLFSVLNSDVGVMAWKTWMTGKRTEQLEELIDRKKEIEADELEELIDRKKRNEAYDR